MPQYLTLDDVLGIHQDSIDTFGGSHGIRDRSGLEAAVMRPRSGVLFRRDCRGTAIASMTAHLAINGYWLRADQLDTYRFMMGLYEAGRFRMAELEVWLRAHAVKRG